MVEALGYAVHHRVFEPFVMQHGRIDKRRQLGLAANDVFRLAAHAIPDRIECRQFRTLRVDLMHRHDCSLKAALANAIYQPTYSTMAGLMSQDTCRTLARHLRK